MKLNKIFCSVLSDVEASTERQFYMQGLRQLLSLKMLTAKQGRSYMLWLCPIYFF
jgi:hypothetical protein